MGYQRVQAPEGATYLNLPGRTLQYDQAVDLRRLDAIECRRIVVPNGAILWPRRVFVDSVLVEAPWIADELVDDPSAEWQGRSGVRPDRYNAFGFDLVEEGEIGDLSCPNVLYDCWKGAPSNLTVHSSYFEALPHPQVRKTAKGGAVHRDFCQMYGAQNVLIRRARWHNRYDRISQGLFVSSKPDKEPSRNVVIEDSQIVANGSKALFLAGTGEGCGARRCELHAKNAVRIGDGHTNVVMEGNQEFNGEGAEDEDVVLPA